MSNIEIHPRHQRAFQEQYWYAENFLEDFLELRNSTSLNILEVGPAEAGLLKYFREQGHNCYGIEFSDVRFESSLNLDDGKKLNLIKGDITKKETFEEFLNIEFDVIVLRDVIEHIPVKLAALNNMADLLKPGGRFFVSFPPKYSPYAGHQQVLTKRLCKLPYLHAFPNFVYSKYLSLFGLSKESVDYYLSIKENRLSIAQFAKLYSQAGLHSVKKESYFLRPCYEYRFNWRRKKNSLSSIKLFDEFMTLGSISWLSK